MSYSRSVFPILSSIGTLFASAGSALFGTNKILNYIFEGEDNIPPYVQYAVYTVVIGSNLAVIADTRVSAIMRDYLKQRYKPAPSERIIISAPPAFSEHKSVNRVAPPALNQPVREFDNADIESFGYNAMEEHTPSQQLFLRNVSSLTEDYDIGLSRKRRIAHHIVYGSLSGLGLASVFFSAIPSYLGAITFFEFMGGDPTKQQHSDPAKYTLISLLHFGAVCATLFKLKVNYIYTYPATRKSASKIADWLILPRNELDSTRCEDSKKYLATLALCSLNILSTPFTAYYSTTQTLYKIPYIQDYIEFIKIFSACSTLSALSSTVLSTAPSVRDSFEKWWYKHEEDSDKINRVYSAQFKLINFLTLLMLFSGFVDSLSTGANNCVSIVNTSNDLFGLDRYDIKLMVFSILCGISAGLVNAAFSVRRGHRAFIKNEVFDYCLRHNWLSPSASQIINPDLQTSLLQQDDSLASTPRAATPLLTEDTSSDHASQAPQRISSLLIKGIQDNVSPTNAALKIVITRADSPALDSSSRAPSAASSLAMPIPPRRAMLGATRSFGDHAEEKAHARHGFFSVPTSPKLKLLEVQSEADLIEENYEIFGLGQ